ncbi:Peptidase U49 [Rhizobium leguminosarum bv. trifolii WSM597]|uniref:Peptidase U49 n=1 Tax=Rhizobium leguminosarum bv. trifolii WSM597 TaxID=754764 RepID=J0HCT8_RHILT|nr:hypothetical protein [Rhizobium leguminosarum]EJB02266.1 Peptidase U49 [Rhizobium leguminosarum bv. trifolii WSM597]EJB08253.1 Peptidase U49 [Rhizobium leguminosarum bv. trifolii WSM597]
MDASSYIAHRKSALGLEDWFLEMIPKDGDKGTDARRLPPFLQRQVHRLGIRGTPREILQQLIQRIDVVDDAMSELLERFPPPLRSVLKPSSELAYGTVNDANFNGEVKRVYQGTGLAVLISYGSYMALYYFGAMQAFCASEQFQTTVSEGGREAFEVRDRRISQSFRRLRIHNARRSCCSKYEAAIPSELLLMAATYKDIGVVDPPTIMREMHLPLPPDPRHLGHPLEAGSHLAHFGQRFLLLHECGHIVNGHLQQTGKNGPQLELEADQWAFEWTVRLSPGPTAAVAALVGAWLALGTAAAIERLDPRQVDTHPDGESRIARLLSFIASTELLSDDARQLASALVSEAQERDIDYQAKVKLLRIDLENLPLTSDTLGRFLDLCVIEGRPQDFKDQFPRWVLLGVPDKLCESLARIRIACERDPQNKSARGKLDLIIWAFDAAKRASSPRIYELLDKAYQNQVGQLLALGNIRYGAASGLSPFGGLQTRS